MKVAFINIARISTSERLQLLLNYCVSNHFHIVCVQEVAFPTYPIPNKAGTAVLVANNISVQYHKCDPDGRLLCVNFGPVSFVSFYAASGRIFRKERSVFFRINVPAFYLFVKKPTVIMGELNAVDERGDSESGRRGPPLPPQSIMISRHD
jgi:exonuclease III